MGPNKPITALNAFNARILVGKKFTDSMALASASPIRNKRYKEMIVEVSFLQAVTAWERFLEDTFLLYAVGKKAHRGYCPRRRIKPASKELAFNIALPEGRPFADWLNVDIVKPRAEKFFKDGGPFSKYLSAKSNCMRQIGIIRNAIAHSSLYAEEKLEEVIKIHVGHSFDMKVGALLMKRPNSSLGTQPSVFDYYLEEMQILAKAIVP